MPTRPKSFLKQAKTKAKKEQQKLEDADDYQAAGVECEDAAGKWRAGDAVKSMRFFQRALELYGQGLTRFPQSFDLAYNKARVQLEIASHPMLVSHLPISVLDSLQIALDSHRYALTLNQDDPDTLFNTSQVLTSIAEIFANDDARSDREALAMLEEALQLQDRCLSVQELKFEQDVLSQQNMSQAAGQSQLAAENTDSDHEEGGASLNTPESTQEEQWFSIVEPVTADTLIDTIIAQLGTLTTLCSILGRSPGIAPGSSLAWVEEYSMKLLQGRLPGYAKQTPARTSEITLARATFTTSLLEAGFRSSRLDAMTYRREIDAAFSGPDPDASTMPDFLLAQARALIAFNSALGESTLTDPSSYASTRWTALDAAVKITTQLSKLADATQDEKAKSQSLRGDASLLQHQLSLPPASYPTAISNKTQLLKNAEIFYRNASKLHLSPQERVVASLRSAIVIFLLNGDRGSVLAAAKGNDEVWLREQLEEMIGDGLLPDNFSL